MAAIITMNIPTEFLAFAQEAREAQESFPDAKSWARAFARKFYHEVSDTPGFLPIYNTLLSLSNETPEQQIAHLNFEDNFDAEFEKALTTIDHYGDLDTWARAEANRIYHVFDRQTKWKVIYDSILEKAYEYIHLAEEQEQEQRSNRRSTSSNHGSTSSNAAAAPVFAEDDEPTEAEQKEGRNQLNRILHREFENWWDAFVAEAEEDSSKKAPSAEDRFCLHAAKVLEKKTGIDREELKPVVGAWLQAKLEAE